MRGREAKRDREAERTKRENKRTKEPTGRGKGGKETKYGKRNSKVDDNGTKRERKMPKEPQE